MKEIILAHPYLALCALYGVCYTVAVVVKSVLNYLKWHEFNKLSVN